MSPTNILQSHLERVYIGSAGQSRKFHLADPAVVLYLPHCVTTSIGISFQVGTKVWAGSKSRVRQNGPVRNNLRHVFLC